ncbi:hypothetical protein MMC31_007360, partial [Peltigera leucophlebia]|nr:hypothetical protein [Peltigera leucophlebia]
MDERYYPDPSKYDPWRFSRAREERQSFGSDSTKPVDNDEPDDRPDNKPNGGYTSSSEDLFAVFGYGKHA